MEVTVRNAQFDVQNKSAIWIFVMVTSFNRRQHSSRMRTARLPTICVSVATTRCQYCWGNPQVNNFEQVSVDDHQMSVVGRVAPRSGIGRILSSQCIMSNGHMGTP